ncbi:Arrestin C-terminal-like domain-containing protein [Pleurotus pulmonarius]
MVHIVLASPKGNSGTRYFPYSGYLGLTPLRVEGVVRVKLDNDGKSLPTKSVTVSIKCYESRLGRVSVLQSNILVDQTQVLWSKPDAQEYADLGDAEFPFRLTLPPNVAGFSTSTFVEYKCTWRVEATIHHAPITGVGTKQVKHSELPLIRYDLPEHISTKPPQSLPFLELQTNKPRTPRIRYCVKTPLSPIGPMDLVPIGVHLSPVDPAVTIRSASVIIERRIQLNEALYSFSPSSQSQPTPRQQTLSVSNHLTSTSYSPTASYQEINGNNSNMHLDIPPIHASSASTYSSTISPSVASFSTEAETRPLLQPSSNQMAVVLPTTTSEVLPSKVVTSSIAGAESSGLFSRDSHGVWNKTLTVQWPAAKSNSRWAIGETIQSDLASVRFFARVKVVVASSTAERSLALSKFNDQVDSCMDPSARSKSKSPRGKIRRDREGEVPLPPAPHSAQFSRPSTSSTSQKTLDRSSKAHTQSMQSSSGLPKAKPSSRRPHTSAGPRDKVLGFGGSPTYNRVKEPEEGRENEAHAHRTKHSDSSRSRPGTASGDSVKSSSKYLFASRISSSSSSGRDSDRSTRSAGSISTNPSSTSGSPGLKEVRAWEEELARIELQSRRSSDMLGFAYKRLKRTFEPSRAS